jgi:hypothetical protein
LDPVNIFIHPAACSQNKKPSFPGKLSQLNTRIGYTDEKITKRVVWIGKEDIRILLFILPSALVFHPVAMGVSWRSAGTYIELLQSQLTKHNSINMECDYGQ